MSEWTEQTEMFRAELGLPAAAEPPPSRSRVLDRILC